MDFCCRRCFRGGDYFRVDLALVVWGFAGCCVGCFGVLCGVLWDVIRG